MESPENLTQNLQHVIDKQREWLLVYESGDTFSIFNNEIDFDTGSEKILIGFLTNNGYETWRLLEFEIDEDVVTAHLTRNFGVEKNIVKLVPRTKAKDLKDTIEFARLEKANKFAKLLASKTNNLKVKRVELNQENGRFAQLTIEDKNGVETAVLSDVSDSLSPEILLSSSIYWLSKLQKRKMNPIDLLWIISDTKKIKNLKKLHACLTTSWKKQIKIKQIVYKKRGGSKNTKKLTSCRKMSIAGLWKSKPPKLRKIEDSTLSNVSKEIIKLAPEKIDCIFSNKGENLRYLGLKFFRATVSLGEEKAWFGVDKPRKVVNEGSLEELDELIKNLKKYRCYDSPNKQHAFYQSSAEAWLEAILLKDINQLDANLILSPVYNQFRAVRDRIDLLALRNDGRLVIIELKVVTDREMVFQAVDYWQKIEHQRRKGLLNKANLFDGKEISDKPAIIYLAAPTLSYHKDFNFLAKTISSQIEIFKFELSENWRENLKVLRRRKIS